MLPYNLSSKNILLYGAKYVNTPPPLLHNIFVGLSIILNFIYLSISTPPHSPSPSPYYIYLHISTAPLSLSPPPAKDENVPGPGQYNISAPPLNKGRTIGLRLQPDIIASELIGWLVIRCLLLLLHPSASLFFSFPLSRFNSFFSSLSL